jgi:hypothetical protein
VWLCLSPGEEQAFGITEPQPYTVFIIQENMLDKDQDIEKKVKRNGCIK